MAQEATQEETSEQFASKLTGIFSDGMVFLATSLGHKTGLIDQLISQNEPKTCKEIADGANLKERYVREWLGLMTTGKIVDIHKDDGELKFILPKHRAHVISDKGGGMGVFSHALPILSQVHGELVECFKKDGPLGIPYESYTGFHEWRMDRMKTKFTPANLMNQLKKIPELVESLEKGITICDMGCSSGHIAIVIAELFPKTQVYGVDIGENAIDIAKTAASGKSLTNCHFHVADICKMPPEWKDKFDFVLLADVLHDLPYVSQGLSEISRTLKKGSYMYVVDIDMQTPMEDNIGPVHSPLIYGLSLFNCVPTSLYHKNSDGMGATWGVQRAKDVIEKAGFSDINFNASGHNVHITARK